MNEEEREFVTKEAEMAEVKDFIREINNEEKGLDNFFLEVVRADDTSKLGNLTEDELGMAHLPLRTLKELAHDCALIPSMSSFKEHFKHHAENMLATSLSKEGFLIKARITQKKELLDNKKKTRRKGLFGRKEEMNNE